MWITDVHYLSKTVFAEIRERNVRKKYDKWKYDKCNIRYTNTLQIFNL